MTYTTKPIRKAIYFDADLLDALRIIQQPGESLSLAVSRLLNWIIKVHGEELGVNHGISDAGSAIKIGINKSVNYVNRNTY